MFEIMKQHAKEQTPLTMKQRDSQQLATIKETPNEIAEQNSKERKETETGEEEFKDVVPTTLFGNMLSETLKDDQDVRQRNPYQSDGTGANFGVSIQNSKINPAHISGQSNDMSDVRRNSYKGDTGPVSTFQTLDQIPNQE